eukprot:TRINITY_DN51401_c0_g1_i1.p1 TRINITY_DN51401_c0_g1~~TRINITY_DN51401_c0_g1_i1.p1  ORF type:complete len:286 (+),score=52.01 TRINITY_DN51401_c0_g1_i1:47-904(+)
MGCCCSSDAPYPAILPESFDAPPGIEVLEPEQKQLVEQAIDVCARGFTGTLTAEPPGEFEWLLSDVPDRTDAERVHRMSAMMAFLTHYSFVLGRRGLVLVAKNAKGVAAWDETAPSGAGPSNEHAKVTGCVMLWFYPKGWSPSTDGMCVQIKAGSNCGGSKWTKSQNTFMNGKRMQCLDKVMQKMHKAHASTPHIYVQVLAVDPEVQGQGVGGKLLRAVNQIADKFNLPLYLECDGHSKNEAVYKKFGYAVAVREDLILKEKGKEDAVFPGGMCAMRREPGTKEG